MRNNLLLAIAIVAMTGCNQDKPVNGEYSDKLIEAKSNVITSKAIIQDGDEFGLQYIRDDKASQDWSGTLVTTTHAANNAITFTEKYLTDNSNSYFKFFSDKGTQGSDADKTKITWTLSGKEDIVYTPTAWDAGNYNTPITSGVTLEHMLTRIEVILACKSGELIGNVTSSWGNITGIKIAGLPKVITYDYAATTNAISYGVALDKTEALGLLAGTSYVNPFASIAIGASDNQTIAGGIMLPAGTSIQTAKLYISTSTVTDQEVDISFANAISAGKINTITLTFSAKDKSIGAASTVKAWEVGTTGSGSL